MPKAIWRGFFLLAVLVLPAGALAEPQKGAPGDDPEGIFMRERLTGEWGGVRKSLEDAGVKFALSEQTEVWSNLRGGYKTGEAANGLATASLTLDLDKIANWQGATFFVNAYQIHGVGPSTALVHNQQLVSGIEATPSTKLYQLWVEQSLFADRLSIRVGQQGANDEFMISEAALLFINSSFGFPDLLAQSLPSGGPNYPLATPMVRTKIKLTSDITFLSAVFNGDPAGPGPGDPQRRDGAGTAFRLSDPPLIFNEVWYQRGGTESADILPGTYKLGAWVHTGRFNDLARDVRGLPLASPFSARAAVHDHDYGAYVVADQMVWKKPGSKDEGVTVFGLLMGAPGDRNPEDLFAEAGVNWKGAIPSRPDDTLGLAVAYAQTSGSLKRFGVESIALTGSGKRYKSQETVVELTYLYQLAPFWTLQPDVQYVINPGAALEPEAAGIDKGLKNALTIGVRSKIEF